ncbi:MAG: D-serine deaminase-like pyridoxal phosphate-dependent protein [Planctomycetota bacterium]
MLSPTKNPFASIPTAAYELPEALLEQLQTPALVVYLDRVRDNIRSMIGYAGSPDRWRPHLKTTKMPEVWGELLQAGVRHFKCATTREADVFVTLANSHEQSTDLLVAYPLRGPALHRLGMIAAQAKHTTMSVLVEDPELLADLPDGMGVFVDVNPGMNRTGIPMADEAAVLAVVRAAGDRFRGLHFYDGHLHDEDLAARRTAIFAGYQRLLQLVALLAGEGIATPELITAGTPAFSHALQFDAFANNAAFVHRISPGTVVFHDARSQFDNPDVELQPAALVLSRVISHPAAGIATCDAGSKSIAAEAGDPCAFVLGNAAFVGLPPSEEHLPLRCTDALPARGTFVMLVPRHVCPTVNLAEQCVLVDGDSPPRVVPVAARAHEL